MLIDGKSWHARIYCWWYIQKYGKTRRRWKNVYDSTGELMDVIPVEGPNVPERSNLCPYMRAVMFWSWMRFLFVFRSTRWKIPTFAWLVLLCEIPRWAGMLSYTAKIGFYFIYGGTSIVAVTVGAVFGLKLLQDKYGILKPISNTMDSVMDSVASKAGKGFNRTADFFELVREYMRSAHDRVCPEVSFTKDE